MSLRSWYSSQCTVVKAAAVTGVLTAVAAMITSLSDIAVAEISDHRVAVSPAQSPSPSLGAMPSPMPLDVTIRSPLNSANLPDNTFGVSGIAKHIPIGESLWLVIEPASYHRWYPVSRINLVGDGWRIGTDKICPAGGRQDIKVFLVPNNAGARLSAYVKDRTSRHDPGISSMPASAKQVAVSHLFIKLNTEKSC